MTDVDHLVVGRGLIGAAAARHLADGDARVAVLGPDEPADRATHDGVFASHYDEGRITRILDPDPTWALLAQRSLARYRDIESAGGVRFFHEAGHLMVAAGPGDAGDYAARVRQVAHALAVDHDELTSAQLAGRFEQLSFGADVVGFHQARAAGHVSPRAQVLAQTRAAERRGVAVLRATARHVRDAGDHVAVTLTDGRTVRTARALVATGGFTATAGLLPRPLDITVMARTVVLVRLSDGDRARLRALPSVIHHPRDDRQGCYILPPIRYPDGAWYLKIGGHTDDRALASRGELQAWFRGSGDPAVADDLLARLHAVVPGLRPQAVHTVSCVTTHTPTGQVYAGRLDGGRIAVVVAGNGSAAKSADELGRMGAMLLRHDHWAHDLPAERFAVRYAD